MVILQFNKLIRNKWIWGAFALAISAFFAFDFLIADINDGGREERGASAGVLAGKPVDAAVFREIADDMRGFGRQRDWKRPQGEVNRDAWEIYAALKVASDNGVEAPVGEVQSALRRNPAFQVNGAFSFDAYQHMLREYFSTSDVRFEAAISRQLTMSHLERDLVGSATWSSPMELDQAVADMTDSFTVKVVRFTQSRKDADAVKVDDAALRKWYDANTNSLALPERVRIRFVKFDATDPKVQAKMTVTEDEMRDRYDVTVDRYTSTDTNGVETVKKFEEVKGEIEKELRKIAAVQFFETNLNVRAYAVKAAKGASRLDEIAKEDSLHVEKSAWFTVDGQYVEGFMRRISQILPGAQGLAEAVAELDPASEDLRYGVVSSDKAVWLIERAELSPKHLPSFDEAKAEIRPRALRDAKADAFKAKVEALIAKGAAAVTAAGESSTNLTFSVTDLKQGEFPDQVAVAQAASKLSKGEISPFTSVGTGRAIVVICEDRVAGDAAKAMIYRNGVAQDLSMMQLRQIAGNWRKLNLERLGFEPTEESSVEVVEEAE